MAAGDPGFETFIRSALKPFQALPFISSGAAAQMDVGDRGSPSVVPPTAAARSMPGRPSNCSGTRTSSQPPAVSCPALGGTARSNTTVRETRRLSGDQPQDGLAPGDLPATGPSSATGNRRRVAELLGLPPEELVAARDDCGAPTLRLQLAQMALLFAHLGASEHAELEQISRAMLSHPDLVAGEGRFDTELMSRSHGQVLSKGGAEGVQCLSRIGEGLGVAIKVEDGARRAKQAVALHLLRQLEWLTPSSLEELEEQVLHVNPGVSLEGQRIASVSDQLKPVVSGDTKLYD